MIAVVVFADEGGRTLLRTADSVARQGGVRELMLALPADRAIPLADAIVRRLGATAVRHGCRAGDAINEAVRLTTAGVLAIVPAGTEFPPRALAAAQAVFEASPNVAAIASPIRIHTPDGLGVAEPRPVAATPVGMLTDPRSVPEALFVSRGAWDRLGGLDGAFGEAALHELWLRLALAGAPIAKVEAALAARELSGTPPAFPGSIEYLEALGRVFERHRRAIEPFMSEVLVAREVRFGRLRARHRQCIDARDQGLASLDGLRSEAAHHRAYLTHHGFGRFDWGDLRRTDPTSRDWGYERGGPVDRPYIERFIESHSSDVHGSVLEVQEDDFTRLAGGPRVASASVVDIETANPRATVIADLRCAPELRTESFDCVILTQTLHVIDDVASVVREVHRVLRPGGVVLATLPAVSRVCLEYGERGDLWRVTPAGAAALFEPAFGDSIDCQTFGNVLTNVAFLHGLGEGELTSQEYDAIDPYYPALTGIRARKGGSGRPSRGAVLLYHRVHDASDVHGLNVTAARLDAHLEWLRRECTIVPLETLLEAPETALPRRAVALTFDDGYEDMLQAAVPVLERHGAPATFFATTRWLEEPGEYWWDALERILLGPQAVPASLVLTLTSGELRISTRSPEERVAAHWQLHPLLVHATLAERDAAIAALDAWSGGSPARYRPMGAEALRALARVPGMSVAAHTVNHLALPDQSAEVALRELVESCDRLSSLCGSAIHAIAYPYGAVDHRVARLVRKHVGWGLSCEGAALSASFDAARVPRLDVRAWNVEDFAARVGGLLEPGDRAMPAS